MQINTNNNQNNSTMNSKQLMENLNSKKHLTLKEHISYVYYLIELKEEEFI